MEPGLDRYYGIIPHEDSLYPTAAYVEDEVVTGGGLTALASLSLSKVKEKSASSGNSANSLLEKMQFILQISTSPVERERINDTIAKIRDIMCKTALTCED